MSEFDDLAATLASVTHAFEELEIRWAVGGSLASTTYGEPRATNDIDVVALLDETGARGLAELLGPNFYCSTDAALDAVRRHDSFNVIDQRNFLKVDVFIPRVGALGTGQLDRRRDLALTASVTVPVLGPEDIILQKLNWYRLGGEVSDRQWRDIVAVIHRCATLDDAYLDEVAQWENLDALLTKARDAAR